MSSEKAKKVVKKVGREKLQRHFMYGKIEIWHVRLRRNVHFLIAVTAYICTHAIHVYR